jgi:lysophospholipase L1-like esterase
MKHTKSLLALLLVLAIGAGLTLPAFAEATVPVQFVVLGDSIADGSNMLNKDRAYAWIVAKEMGWELRNFALGGSRSADLLQQLREDQVVQQAVREADVINVSIGGNDFLHAEDLTALITDGMLGDISRAEPILDTFRDNLNGIITALHDLNPEATLVVQTLYNAAIPLPSLYQAYDAAMTRMNEVIRMNHAKQPDAYVITDVYTAFQGRSGLVSFDMTHPSAAGHEMIAAVLLDTLNGTQTEVPPVYGGMLDWLAEASKPALALLDKVVTFQPVLTALKPFLWLIDKVLIEWLMNEVLYDFYIRSAKNW